MNKALLTMLVAVVLGGVGVFAVNRHDNIKRAITIAKESNCWSADAKMNNVAAIKITLRGDGVTSSVSSVQGWRARPAGNDTYLVWFEFTKADGKKSGYFAEVNLNAETALGIAPGTPIDEHYKPLIDEVLHHRRLIDKIFNR